ncbi:nuclear transport factor 2 family protein [Devosia sp. FKR38]|uniref:nuclear transport factor 2 family protein n=1 Tax=Devosia sp. FKR38 TaxID=2562312 RepID=UPI0010BFAE14|nr:nuclear transport factor 2 family protein [Devosia sp. FKR38]
MDLPLPIETFFEADKNLDGAAPVSAFATNATVMDEGQTHVGRIAIADWWRAAKRKYRHTAAPLDMRQSNGLIEVRAMVTGDFPGSPAPLTFVFALADGYIVSLKIGA